MWFVRRWRLAAEIALRGGDHDQRGPRSSLSIPTLSTTPAFLPDPPLSLGGEGLGFVVAGGGSDDFISVFVHRAGLCGRQL